MKNKIFKLLMLSSLICGYSTMSAADAMRDASKEGSNLGKSSVNQAKSAITEFNPEKELEGFTRNPSEVNYQKNDGGLTQDGNKALVDSELGKAARDSFINNPKDNISWDSDIIQSSLNIKENAAGIVSGTGESCVKQTQSESYFTNHFCEKEENISVPCSRKAIIKENKKMVKKQKEIQKKIKLNLIDKRERGRWGWIYSKMFEGSFTIPDEYQLKSVRVYSDNVIIPYNNKCGYSYNRYRMDECKRSINEEFHILGKTLPVEVVYYPKYNQICSGGKNDNCRSDYYDGKGIIDTAFDIDKKISAGEKFVFTKTSLNYERIREDSFEATITFVVEYDDIEADPKIEWVDTCSIDKGNAVKINDVCVEEGGIRSIISGGKEYRLNSECWAYAETWEINGGDDNTCGKYESNPNCTVGERKCLLKVGNVCIHNEIKYQCQHTTKTEGYVCGSKFFCDDGSCVDTIGSENNGFNEAVSQLASISQAGKEMAGFNEENMKAFSGKAMHCRKAAAGFSNCCKSGGWGKKVGLAHCNSDENALGEAKEKNIVISVGTYCSRKVLGACLQKKSSYCVFDNKLARIVQAQGRSGQLGIGFGSAKNPDCRGITVNELQRLRFDHMDFSDFYEDLQGNLKIPEQDKLINEVNRRMQEKFEEGKK
ncbi:conjugal transfer protein TraN [Xenorhabdus ishibashii]|uniref:Conjugal transfer protein TraN n=1 Tax=Xenorhabdus ishibashii TaxID=1034471 RepID=A0A2D0K805_9GAMM|nr:conjugal transfer protein TraN [Xenorhabdus ishibashii]PHM59561.1 conjugal transfer protein TraN [Xenorhabdus ishibashii]